MANAEQLAILKQGVDLWNEWRSEQLNVEVDLREADLREFDLHGADLMFAQLSSCDLRYANLAEANLREADLGFAKLSDAQLFSADLLGSDLQGAHLSGADLRYANLSKANLMMADLIKADLTEANLSAADLKGANLKEANLRGVKLIGTNLERADLTGADLTGTDFSDTTLRFAKLWRAKLIGVNLRVNDFQEALVAGTIFADLDLSNISGLEDLTHGGPSHISTDTFAYSKGRIPEVFLRGCGLSDWEIEVVKLYDPDLSNEERNTILYKAYDLRASQPIQIAPLFISYSHADNEFVDKIGNSLKTKGIRYWRDIHDMRAGRIEKQIDRGIRQNPTVLLILSEHSLKSDWVEHEVRTARELEKEMERDVLCPVALDDSWKSSRWPKRVMEQITEYNILDFSAWQDASKFRSMFSKLIDGLELFYKKG